MRRLRVAVALCVLASLGIMGPSGPADAFSSYGLDEHENIVRNALSCQGKPAARVNPTCFEPKSLDRLADGVFAPDSTFYWIGEETVAAAHCDNGDFLAADGRDQVESVDWIVEEIKRAGGSWRLMHGGRAELDRRFRQMYPFEARIRGVREPIRLRGQYPQKQQAAIDAIAACRDRYRTRATAAAAAALEQTKDLTRFNQPCQAILAWRPEDPAPATASQKCYALYQFGRGLHIVQDFYSHSNWVDPGSKPGQPLLLVPPGLNQTESTSRMFDLTAVPNEVPAGLITGCYYEDRRKCAGRVIHGSWRAPEWWALSKDDERYDSTRAWTARPSLFPTAFKLAVDATREQWAQLKIKIRDTAASTEQAELAICLMTHDNANACTGPRVTTTSLPGGQVGQAYSAALAAIGGTQPYTWSVLGLPAGLRVDAATGVISGTPTAATTPASVLVTVTDKAGAVASATLSLTVQAGPPPTQEPGSREILTDGAGYGAVPGPDGRVWLVARDTAGARKTRIQAVDPVTFAIQTYSPTPAPESFTTAPTFDGSGNLWLADINGKVARFTPASGAFTEFPLPAECGSVSVAGLHTATDGTVWVNCNGGSVVHVTTTGSMTLIRPPAEAPVLGPLTPGPNGSMWAIGSRPGVSSGVVKITAGSEPTLFADTNGIGGYKVVGNGSRVVEVGYCPGRVDVTCLQAVDDSGGRTQLNTRENAPPDLLRTMPLVAPGGDVWTLVNSPTTGLYYYQFGASGTVHRFTLPPDSRVTTLITGLDIPPVMTADAALWVEETSTGNLLRVTV